MFSREEMKVVVFESKAGDLLIFDSNGAALFPGRKLGDEIRRKILDAVKLANDSGNGGEFQSLAEKYAVRCPQKDSDDGGKFQSLVDELYRENPGDKIVGR